MSLQSFIQILLVLVVLFVFAALAGVIGYATVPDAADLTDRVAVQEAKQAGLKRGGFVFVAVMTLGVAVMGMLIAALH